MELALEEAERENATPKPEANDLFGPCLLLGEYALCLDDVQKAGDLYLFCTKSEDPNQAKLAQLGHLKARLNYPDEKDTWQHLKSLLPTEGGEGKMPTILKMTAQDDLDHGSLMLKIFILAKRDADLTHSRGA